ncbi:cytochrome p450 domain-containing protein [Phthorimaea operculella]|nr:cytochrome p450 domain-containing protein [Phthorimaea operculella]
MPFKSYHAASELPTPVSCGDFVIFSCVSKMLLNLLGCVLIFLLCLLYLKWTRVKSYWSKKNVPHAPPHLFLGSLTYLQKKNAGEWMKEQYVKFKKAPYFGIWLFWRPALVINSPDIARNILVRDSDNFRNRFLSSGKTDPIGSLHLFTVNDPLWSTVRRKITTAFTSLKLKALQPMLIAKSNDLCKRIHKEIAQKEDVDIRDVFTDFSTDVVGIGSFGIECNSTLTGDGPMRRVTRGFQEYSFFRGLGHLCIFFIPELVDIFRCTFFPKDATDYFSQVFRTVLKQRGGLEKPVEEVKDFVDSLIKLKQDEKDNELITMDVLTAQAAVFVQGGFETTATTLAFVIYELAYNPECQERLYQEIRDIKEKLDGKEFTNESLDEAVYMKACINEALRKFPPMGWLDRVAAKDYNIDENLTIPAGTPVYINGIAIQMDPDYFPEPDKFIPDRFLPENEKNIQPFTNFPFGEGPRMCIGRRFAYTALKQALAALILSFKLKPQPKMPEPNKCQMEKNSLFLLPAQKISIIFEPRV